VRHSFFIIFIKNEFLFIWLYKFEKKRLHVIYLKINNLNLKKKVTTMNNEELLQQKVVIWFKNNYQMHGKGLIFAVPNGGSRHAGEAKRMKETGTMAGVSDLIVLLPNVCLFVELKTDLGKQSETQKTFEQKVKSLGFTYEIIRTLDEFVNVMLKY